MDVISDYFLGALKDYAYLINRSYPGREILKLVGNRYQLNRLQRLLLSRGVFRQQDIERRKSKKVRTVDKGGLYVDSFNVLFTIGNYLLGRLVFISNDHFLRDGGEISGKLHQDKTFIRALELLLDYLSGDPPEQCVFMVDEPVSGSTEVVRLMEEMIREREFPGAVRNVRDPDEFLITLDKGVVASSDSEILDQSDCSLIDLAFEVLDANYHPEFINMADLLA